jgi:uncharacterized beta-barrel protein YwiB (DUF1934 family)
MQLELYAEQIYADNKQKEKIIYDASLFNAKKGSILEFWNKQEKNKMTILENKILLKKQNQDMVFELGRTTTSVLQTQYGALNMNITTQCIDIIKENEQINKIKLVYDIEIEGVTKYKNIIEIKIKYFM